MLISCTIATRRNQPVEDQRRSSQAGGLRTRLHQKGVDNGRDEWLSRGPAAPHPPRPHPLGPTPQQSQIDLLGAFRAHRHEAAHQAEVHSQSFSMMEDSGSEGRLHSALPRPAVPIVFSSAATPLLFLWPVPTLWP